MPASISMSKILSLPASSSTSLRCGPRNAAPAAFARNPGAPPRSLRSSEQFVGSCHAGASTETSLGGASGEGTSAGGYEDGGLPFVKLSYKILQAELNLLKDDKAPSPLFTTLPSLLKGNRGDGHLESTPAYPAAMNALYAACLAGNATEHLWNFTWPAAIAMLHQSLLPVAVLGFFTKLVVFVAGPLVGDLVSSLPRIPAYRSLTVIQTVAHLVSAAMIMRAFTDPRASTALELLLRPWFAVLVASTAVDRLSCVSLGIIVERDFVMQLTGKGRPVALANANATLSSVELICETAGASIFAHLLSKNDPLTCIRLSCLISLCSACSHMMNNLADGIFDHSEHRRSPNAAYTFDIRRIVGDASATIRRGWSEYMSQPVLPASLAYVLVCFNVALAPGALMTTFLIHQGTSPLVLGAFGGSSALMGILATFMTPSLVKELGILKAGAAGLLAQSALLSAAVLVYMTGSISRRGAMLAFLGLIVASRVGHMAYSVIGLQVVQTWNYRWQPVTSIPSGYLPIRKAKLISATEIAVASLAELGMMAVAVAAKDVSRFGAVAVLSAAAVAAASCLYSGWLANPTHELKTLFPS